MIIKSGFMISGEDVCYIKLFVHTVFIVKYGSREIVFF